MRWWATAAVSFVLSPALAASADTFTLAFTSPVNLSSEPGDDSVSFSIDSSQDLSFQTTAYEQFDAIPITVNGSSTRNGVPLSATVDVNNYYTSQTQLSLEVQQTGLEFDLVSALPSEQFYTIDNGGIVVFLPGSYPVESEGPGGLSSAVTALVITDTSLAPVPEPGSIALLSTGMCAALTLRRR